MKRWIVRERRGLWSYRLVVSEALASRDVGAFEATPTRTFSFRGHADGQPYRFVVRREGFSPQRLTANVLQRAEEGGGERVAASATVPLLWGRKSISLPDGRAFGFTSRGFLRTTYVATAEGSTEPALRVKVRRGIVFPPLDVEVAPALAEDEKSALAMLGLLLEIRRMEQARVI